MKSLAVIVSGGSTNNLIQVLTLLMAAVHSQIKSRVLFRDESLFRLTPSTINQPEYSASYGDAAGSLHQRLKKWGLMRWGPTHLNPVVRFYDRMSVEAYRTKPSASRAALDLIAVCRTTPA